MRPRTNSWQRYEPDAAAPWNVARVVHLHRRAGFAANWGEIERDLADGPAASVDRLLFGAGGRPADDVDRDLEPISSLLVRSAVESRDCRRLQAWWLHRMVFTRHPLRERLALLWHDHFATSAAKVTDLALLRAQNELFRRHALGKFGDLLHAVIADPAVLLFLDAASNRKEHPNENLARELLELFTLGVGHYSEADVKESARALTGWAVDSKGRLRLVAAHHDDGEKRVLGRSGALGRDELLETLLAHPACAGRIARRLCELLMSERGVDDDALGELAAGLREHELSIGWGIATVLRSRRFFADENVGGRVLGPVEFVVGALRAFERLDPAPSTLLVAECVARLGQELFLPPNVFGWPGGRAWITTASVVARARAAAAVVEGALHSREAGAAAPFDLAALARLHGAGGSLDEVAGFVKRLLFGTESDRASRAELAAELATPERARAAVSRLLATPLASLS